MILKDNFGEKRLTNGSTNMLLGCIDIKVCAIVSSAHICLDCLTFVTIVELIYHSILSQKGIVEIGFVSYSEKPQTHQIRESNVKIAYMEHESTKCLDQLKSYSRGENNKRTNWND